MSLFVMLPVLFEPRTNLASHLARSPSSHSYCYDFSDDRTTCFASFALHLEPFINWAGKE